MDEIRPGPFCPTPRRRVVTAALLAAPLLLTVGASDAQRRVQHYGQRCKPVTPDFDLATTKRLSGAELRALLTDRTLVSLREIEVWTDGTPQGEHQLRIHGRPTHRRLSVEFRGDGSARFACEALFGLGGRVGRCPDISYQADARGPVEVGTWRVWGSALCTEWSRLGEACTAIYRRGAAYWTQPLTGGPECRVGPVEIR
jgi:hypothetical protein